MIAVGNSPGMLCMYVDGHLVTQGITLDDYPLQEESGSVVTCEPITGYKLGITSHITAVQEGEGDPSPDNVRPIRGWDAVTVQRAGRNLVKITATSQTIKGVTFAVANGVITVNGTAEDDVYLRCGDDFTLPAGTYALSGTPAGMQQSFQGAFYDDNKNLSVSNVVTTVEKQIVVKPYIVIRKGFTADNVVFRPQIERANAASDFEPYTGETHTAALPETVYGGTLDWRTGLLTVDRSKYIVTGNEEWTRNNDYGRWQTNVNVEHQCSVTHDGACLDMICTHAITAARINTTGVWVFHYRNNQLGLRWKLGADKDFADADALKAYLAEQYAAGTPMEYVYKLANPYTIQLTPQQLVALAGTNTIYSNSGDTTVTYRIRNI